MSSLDQARALLQGTMTCIYTQFPPMSRVYWTTLRCSPRQKRRGDGWCVAEKPLRAHRGPGHSGQPTGRASGLKPHGAAVLNWPLGGLNPYAVPQRLENGGPRDLYANPRRGQLPVPRGICRETFSSGRASAYWISRGICAGKSTRSSKWSGYRALLATGHISPWNPSCSAGRAAGWGVGWF